MDDIRIRLEKVKYRIIIMSGKGGVGKTMITVNIAEALALKGYKVSIFDCDLHGPSVPKMLGLSNVSLLANDQGIYPHNARNNIEVVSMDFLLPSEESPVIWRGPIKTRAIMELLSRVNWGERDFLLVDLPPGTGDESLSIVQFIPNISGSILITIPSRVSEHVVRKAVSFTRQLNIPILGIIENMSYFICPNCGAKYNIFGKGGGYRIAREMNIRFLGEIPLDPRLAEACDKGLSFLSIYPESETAKVLNEIALKILGLLGVK